MRWFKNMRIAVKLIGAFAILLVLFTFGIVSSSIGLNRMSDNMERLYQREFKIVETCMGMQTDIQKVAKGLSRACTGALNVEGLIDSEAAVNLDELIAATKESLSSFKEKIDLLNGFDTEDNATLDAVNESYPLFLELSNQILGCYDAGNVSEGVRLTANKLDAVAVEIGTAVDTLTKNADARAEEKYLDNQALFDTTQAVSSVLLGVLLAFCAAFCLVLTVSVTRPLRIMEDAAKKLSGGDLSQKIGYESKSELGCLAASMRETISSLNLYVGETSKCLEYIGDGKLNYKPNIEFKGDFISIKRSLDDISENLTRTMTQINSSAEQVAGGAQQIASGAQALSQATIEQASSVEELSATINDVSDRVRENADNAITSSHLAQSVGEEVSRSGEDVQRLSRLMAQMKEMSGKISGIIEDIKEIAFQTNILSLNAAVEASRAGEAGKGFSVVSNEIRRLSAKTAEASKSSRELIGKAVELMNKGSDMADDTCEKLTGVVKAAKDAAERVQAISVASNDQASAVVQLRESIGQISSVVQENSATAEESAASSEELNVQMRMLKELVESFEFDETETNMAGARQ